jgi:hypothetical protein
METITGIRSQSALCGDTKNMNAAPSISSLCRGMNLGCILAGIAIAIFPFHILGADSTSRGNFGLVVSGDSVVLTNRYSSWVTQRSNLTARTACPPWGCSYEFSSFVLVDTSDAASVRRQDAMRTLARNRAAQKSNETAFYFLKPANFSAIYGVSLGAETNNVQVGK